MADNDKDNPEQQAPDVMGEAARWRTDADTAADAPPGVSRGQSETGDNTASAADTTADIIAASGSPEAAETTAQHDLLSAAPSEGTGVTGNVHANDPKQSRWPRISRLFLRSTWQGK